MSKLLLGARYSERATAVWLFRTSATSDLASRAACNAVPPAAVEDGVEPRHAVLEAADHRRVELADFLRTRRLALAPESVGLEAGPRRRTPGLRREEVAERAGISVALYTWLEQGRDVPVSGRTIDAVAAALAFTPAERLHVHRLTQRIEVLAETLTPALARFVNATKASGILVLNRRFDILLDNVAAIALFEHEDTALRNVLESVMLGAGLQRLFVDWPSVAAFVVANFRIDYALHADEPATVDLLARLERGSPAFVELWRQHDIILHPEGPRAFVHPRAGEMTLETTLLTSVESPDLKLMAFTPVDPASEAKLAALVAGAG